MFRCYFLIALMSFINVSYANDTSIDQLEQQAQKLTQQYGSKLKAVLQSTMMTSGPVQAIQVCRTNAPQIANQVGQANDWQVARTSSKVRNLNNKADAWETAVLAEWEDKISRGAPIQNLKKSEVVEQNGVQVYRYMKAIAVGDVCLNCHGQHLSGPVQQALKDLYPQDQAIGYTKGQLRGAFSLQKPLSF